MKKSLIIVLVVGMLLVFANIPVSVSAAGNNTTNNITIPKISNIKVGDTTTSSVNISFSVNPNNARTRINYGAGDNLDKWSGWNNGTISQRRIKLSGLLNGTTYNFSIYAYNRTNQSFRSNTDILSFKTNSTISIPTDNNPNITATSPDQIVNSISGENINFTISFDKPVNVTWYLNGSKKKDTEKLVKSAFYNNNGTIGTWNVTATGRNRNGSVSYSWTWFVHPQSYKVGNRIWDSTKDMSTTYTWNSYSFAGFYYDIDNNVLTEELTITNIDRSLNKGDIVYKTSPIEVNFEHDGFGKYQVIGFMADKYFAGYSTNSTISDHDEISTLSNGNLYKVLLDDDSKRTVEVGSTLTLEEGYVLKMKEIDVGEGTGKIWVVLLKDGVEVDDGIISAGEDYIYSKKSGGIDSLPIIAAHFDSVFRGREVNAAFLRGLFQISDEFTEIKSGTRYDKMEISTYGQDKIVMENVESIGLSQGDTIDLMGSLRIIVADSSDLRFALSVERTGTFEARGTIYPLATEWTPLNFGLDIGGKNVGFYYDIDEDIGTEKLTIKNISGRSIPDSKLVYSTSTQEVSFSYDEFGKYNVIGFLAEKYFAGYTDNSIISDKKDINVISNGHLFKVLLDDQDKRTLTQGGTLSLADNYVLKMTDVDVGAGPGQIWLVLLNNGAEVDSGVIAGGATYIYTKKVDSLEIPIIAVHFDSVFRGREVNAAFIKGIFQISDEFTEIKSGDTYGKMEISEVSGNRITMENKDSIGLSAGETIGIMGNINFKVADSSELRFYPYVLVTSEMVIDQLVIDAPIKANTGDTISINVTANNVGIEGVSISIDPEIGSVLNKTDSNGILNYTIPLTLKGGNYTITATKDGLTKGTRNIEIQYSAETNRLNINAPAVANQFENITIQVIFNDTGVSGATVAYDNNTIGLTDINGTINYTLESSGTHTITASKQGYTTVSRDIEVRMPFSEFKALDINIIPNKVFIGRDILVRSNISNIGTKADTKMVDLIINGSVADNKSIILNPNEIKEINFTYKVSLPEGNYTVEVLGQKGMVEVQKSSPGILWILALITIVGAVIIYVITLKDKTVIASTIESIRQKIKRK